ncbi:putative transcription factor B3-Domain family [Helianthus anomalus]
MNSTKRAHSFITFVDKKEPVFFVIPNDFATTLSGDKIPYYKIVEIQDGDNLRMVRIRKTNDGTIFTDGWIMLVRDHQLKYKDGVLIKAGGQFTFEVSCFKELLMPDKFFNDFYAQNFKGGMATVYFGKRFWNVKLEEASENGCFKAGWRKVVEESTADADVIVKSMLPADVSEDDLERKPKGVKCKSKLDDGQTQRTLRSRVEKVNAAPIIGSSVLKFTKLAEDRSC